MEFVRASIMRIFIHSCSFSHDRETKSAYVNISSSNLNYWRQCAQISIPYTGGWSNISLISVWVIVGSWFISVFVNQFSCCIPCNTCRILNADGCLDAISVCKIVGKVPALCQSFKTPHWASGQNHDNHPDSKLGVMLYWFRNSLRYQVVVGNETDYHWPCDLSK